MKKILIILAVFSSIWSVNVAAYVSCTNVKVKVDTASSAGFHNFSEVGVVGGSLFISVPAANCTNSTGGAMASTIFFVIDDFDNSGGLKKLWASILLSAEARNKTMNFHATDKGKNSRGFQVLMPYYFTIN